ncbi:MAG: HmuY family protein, partial [Flavobacteriales bacterium]|nr:HmuY family protein [Flavobacteriales bacterium]
MKTIQKSILIGLLALPFLVVGQETDVTVSMQAMYTQQVFYSLDSGEVRSVSNENWDLAFSMYGQGAAGSAILINEATTYLFEAPNDTSDWATLDTAGISNWITPLNSDTSWTNGAFNTTRGAESGLDLGWGILNPTNNYWTFGDSLYVVQLSDGSWKKLWIESLKTGVWNFRYADLDGNNDVSVAINKVDHPNRNFIYYSLENGALVDREPDNTTWDLTFAKHRDFISYAGMEVSVTGVFNNRNVWSAKANVNDLSEALAVTAPQTEFTQNVINIGREWKDYDSGSGWAVYDTIAYFVYDEDSTDFYKLIFTGFGGMSTGEANFIQTRLTDVSVEENRGADIFMSIYPNPATNNFTLLLDNREARDLTLCVIDVQGRLVKSQTWKQEVGVHQQSFSTRDLPAGMYLLRL